MSWPRKGEEGRGWGTLSPPGRWHIAPLCAESNSCGVINMEDGQKQIHSEAERMGECVERGREGDRRREGGGESGKKKEREVAAERSL